MKAWRLVGISLMASLWQVMLVHAETTVTEPTPAPSCQEEWREKQRCFTCIEPEGEVEKVLGDVCGTKYRYRFCRNPDESCSAELQGMNCTYQPKRNSVKRLKCKNDITDPWQPVSITDIKCRKTFEDRKLSKRNICKRI